MRLMIWAASLPRPFRDNPQGLLTGLIGRPGNTDGALSGGEGLVAGQEGEALGLIPQQHGAQVAVAQTHLAVFRHGAGDAEGLQAHADQLGSLGCGLDSGLQRDGRAHGISPAGISKQMGWMLFTIS